MITGNYNDYYFAYPALEDEYTDLVVNLFHQGVADIPPDMVFRSDRGGILAIWREYYRNADAYLTIEGSVSNWYVLVSGPPYHSWEDYERITDSGKRPYIVSGSPAVLKCDNRTKTYVSDYVLPELLDFLHRNFGTESAFIVHYSSIGDRVIYLDREVLDPYMVKVDGCSYTMTTSCEDKDHSLWVDLHIYHLKYPIWSSSVFPIDEKDREESMDVARLLSAYHMPMDSLGKSVLYKDENGDALLSVRGEGGEFLVRVDPVSRVGLVNERVSLSFPELSSLLLADYISRKTGDKTVVKYGDRTLDFHPIIGRDNMSLVTKLLVERIKSYGPNYEDRGLEIVFSNGDIEVSYDKGKGEFINCDTLDVLLACMEHEGGHIRDWIGHTAKSSQEYIDLKKYLEARDFALRVIQDAGGVILKESTVTPYNVRDSYSVSRCYDDKGRELKKSLFDYVGENTDVFADFLEISDMIACDLVERGDRYDYRIEDGKVKEASFYLYTSRFDQHCSNYGDMDEDYLHRDPTKDRGEYQIRMTYYSGDVKGESGVEIEMRPGVHTGMSLDILCAVLDEMREIPGMSCTREFRIDLGEDREMFNEVVTAGSIRDSVEKFWKGICEFNERYSENQR